MEIVEDILGYIPRCGTGDTYREGHTFRRGLRMESCHEWADHMIGGLAGQEGAYGEAVVEIECLLKQEAVGSRESRNCRW